MWGNTDGLLEELFSFARERPQVILELKTKSANIAYLLENPPPPNVLVTWTLNSRQVIDFEEHGTASLDERLEAAARVAAAGSLVGFHLHPMVPHLGWEEAYGEVFSRLLAEFDPARVAMVSLGTLTFIKPVIRAIRERGEKTQVLRMPLTGTAGKLSYPETIKTELFRFAYRSLAPWHRKVFFYLCMEPAELWEPVFGFSYQDNENFEAAMKNAYLEKIRR
jgi:spore photoproduct lyase